MNVKLTTPHRTRTYTDPRRRVVGDLLTIHETPIVRRGGWIATRRATGEVLGLESPLLEDDEILIVVPALSARRPPRRVEEDADRYNNSRPFFGDQMSENTQADLDSALLSTAGIKLK